MAQVNIPPLSRSRIRTRPYDVDQGDNLSVILQAIAASLIPSGSIIPTLSDAEPGEAFKHLNGQWLSKADFPRLYDIFGGSEGETADTFRLPDYRGRAVIGAGGALGVALRGLTGAAQVTLQASQMPAHAHDVVDAGHAHSFTGSPHTHTFTGAGHTHSAVVVGSNSAAAGADVAIPAAGNTGSTVATGTIGDATATGTIGSATTGVTIQPAGGNAPIDILPPVVGVHWLVKT